MVTIVYVEGYNWMAPSMQSVDSSSSYSSGSVDPQGKTPSSTSSSFLFKVPTSRPRRPVGPNFGKERMRPDDGSLPAGVPEYKACELQLLGSVSLAKVHTVSSNWVEYLISVQ